MNVESSSPQRLKRRRFTNVDPMEAQEAKAKLNAANEKFGREIRVFETSSVSSSSPPTEVSISEETDETYEFTSSDYYRMLATKKEDKYLKTRKIREAEEAARRSKISKAVIRTRFPDNHTFEATFHPSENIQSLFDLISKVISHPDLPFYIYTTPPKTLIKDMSKDFYSAGFIPGAIVYFSYAMPKGNGDSEVGVSGPFLRDEIMSLKGLDQIAELVGPTEPEPEPEIPVPAVQPVVEERDKPKTTDKKPVKPKWLKL